MGIITVIGDSVYLDVVIRVHQEIINMPQGLNLSKSEPQQPTLQMVSQLPNYQEFLEFFFRHYLPHAVAADKKQTAPNKVSNKVVVFAPGEC